MNRNSNRAASHLGFTLVELMVTMVVAFLVSAAVYASYKVQQRTHIAQMQVSEVQQNLRAAMDMIRRDFIMVGFDPKFTGYYWIQQSLTVGGTTYETDDENFAFTADYCEDGSENPTSTCPNNSGPYENENIPEQYLYQLYTPGTADADDTTALRRLPNGQAIAENIEFLQFQYILDTGAVTPKPTSGNIDAIRAIRVTLLARADDPDYNYTNTEAYTTGSGVTLPVYNDNFRRRILIQTIELRNAGMI